MRTPRCWVDQPVSTPQSGEEQPPEAIVALLRPLIEPEPPLWLMPGADSTMASCNEVAVALSWREHGSPRVAEDFRNGRRDEPLGEDPPGPHLHGVDQGRRDDADHRRAERGWLEHAGGGERALPRVEGRGLRLWNRHPCLHAWHAARLRRRPHRSDRQHHSQAHPGW